MDCGTKGGFVLARLVPIHPAPGAWLISGMMTTYRKSDAEYIAKIALELAARRVRGMGVAYLGARLDDRFRLLVGGDRAAVPAHRGRQLRRGQRPELRRDRAVLTGRTALCRAKTGSGW